jgi:peptidyl-prolyl cis-trans isomerase B (cyclophilin B)
LNNIQAGLDAKTDGQVKITADMADEYETVGGTPFLDGMYTVFGEVIEGLDIVKKIQDVATDKNDRPLEDVKIIRATVVK